MYDAPAAVYGTSGYHLTSKEQDGESGLDYFLARHYSSTVGRFLQPDEFAGGPADAFSSNDPLPPGPLPYADITNPQSLNKYAYTYSNPLNYVDPNGHDLKDFIFGVINAVSNNSSLGVVPREDSNNPDIQAGQRVGDAASVAIGGAEMLAGAAATAGGFAEAAATSPAAATGVGAVVPAAGLVTAAAGATMVGHGTTTAANGLNNLLKEDTSSSRPKEGSSGGPSAGRRATQKQREEALKENNGKCVFCGKKANEVDHAIPKSRGGNTSPENLQGTCTHDNRCKGAKTTQEYLDSKKKP